MKSLVIRISFLALLIIFFVPNLTSAATKTFIKEYTYQASELDSKMSCRVIALEQVKRLVLEELGTYLVSETRIKNYQINKDEITAITAGTVSIKVIGENWNGVNYWLKASVEADPDEVAKAIESLRGNYHTKIALEKSMRENAELLKEIEQLKVGLKSVKGKALTKKKGIYQDTVNKLSANDYFQNGYRLKKAGDYVSAIDNYNKAVKLDPTVAIFYWERSHAYFGLANELGNSKRSLDAIAKLRQALNDSTKAIEIKKKEKSPILLDYCFLLRAHIYNQMAAHYDTEKGAGSTKKNVEAAEYFRKALDDSDMAIRLSYNNILGPDAQMYIARGIALNGLKQYRESIKALNNANKHLEIHPDKGMSAAVFFYLTLNYGFDEFGEKYLDAPVRLYPSYQAELLISKGKYNEAIVALDKAIQFDEEDTWSYYMRGQAYLALKNYGQALQDLNRAIQLNKSYKKAYMLRSNIYCTALNNCKQAIKDTDICIKLDPTDAYAFYLRGYYYSMLDDKTQSINDFNKAIELNPTKAEYYSSRGSAYVALGQKKEGIEDIKTAARLGDERAMQVLKGLKIQW